MTTPGAPALSVVIPTRNRAQLLARALHSVSEQTLSQERFEVLVVDNGSSDDTSEVVNRARGSLPSLRHIYADSPGLHVGRHTGLLHGRGEIIVFADDDVRAFPSWLASIEDCFRDSTVGLAGGKCLPDFETAPPEWFDSLWASVMGGRAIGAFSLIDLGEVMRDIPHHLIWGCNFAVRREVALGLGGFNPDAFPESMQKYRGDGETGLARRIAAHGLRAVYHPLASVYHYVSSRRMTLDYLYSRAFAQGISDSYTATRRRRSAFPKYMRALVTARAARIVAALGIRAGDRGSAARVRSAMSTGYVAGLHYHQSELRTDRHLREWVLRESYLDNEPPRID